MEENKQFTEKQTQAGDDSGYSNTSISTQSKNSVEKLCHNQSGSSGDSCFDDQRPTTLISTKKRTISTLKYKTIEQPNETALNHVSGLMNAINQESNKKKTKYNQINSMQYKPQINRIFSTDDVKQPRPTSKIEFDETKHLYGDTKINHDQNNITFHHLTNLYQSFHMNKKNQTSNSENEFTIKGAAIKEVNYQEILLKKLIESTDIHDNIFGVIVSMSDGLIINTSNSIQKNMGYPSDMWQGRSFVDFIHPKDHVSFISYVTSVLADPYTVSKQDDTSSVTFFKSKNNDGFYCNMRRSRNLNSGFYSSPQNKNYYQMCKLTMSFKEFTYLSTSSSTHLAKRIKTPRPKLILIVNAQLIHSAYTYPEEILESPVNFITKHNALFEWIYVDHLITSHFGYLPQNIIGKSIFGYYNQEDVTTIKEVHENMTKDKSIAYLRKSYRFKCQNGNLALVETEWSNFVNPWSGRAEFYIGKHKIIQGPINPDVTNPAVHYKLEKKITNDKKNENTKKIMNKNIYDATEASLRINNMTNLNTELKDQISKKIQELRLYKKCFKKIMDASIQVPLVVEVPPETCGSFSYHSSLMLGEISPHHNYENKSSLVTPPIPRYTQLNYNNNIQSDLKTNSKENFTDQRYLKETANKIVTRDPLDKNMDKAQKDTLLQSVTLSSSNACINHSSACYSEQNSSKNNEQPLTQNVFLRHNKKVKCDLVKHHNNYAKKNKSSENPITNLPEKTKNINDITHGFKCSNSIRSENISWKLSKKNPLMNSDSIIETQAHANGENIVADTHSVANTIQIWSPHQYQIKQKPQTIANPTKPQPDLSSQMHCYNNYKYYNAPLGNNLMSMKTNDYESAYSLMDPCKLNQEPLCNQLQSLAAPLSAKMPVTNNIPQHSQILQYHNMLLLQPYQNVQLKPKTNLQSESPVPVIPNAMQTMTQKTTQALQVNQEDVITSSDSEYKKEYGSLKSSSGCTYDDSSSYSSSLYVKTDSSDQEQKDCSWPTELNKINFADQFIQNQRVNAFHDLTPDLIFRYQIKHGDIDEILRKDRAILNTFTQPTLVNEQLRQLSMNMNVNSNGEDECLNLLESQKERPISPEWLKW